MKTLPVVLGTAAGIAGAMFVQGRVLDLMKVEDKPGWGTAEWVQLAVLTAGALAGGMVGAAVSK